MHNRFQRLPRRRVLKYLFPKRGPGDRAVWTNAFLPKCACDRRDDLLVTDEQLMHKRIRVPNR
jgi:hypothetical protein